MAQKGRKAMATAPKVGPEFLDATHPDDAAKEVRVSTALALAQDNAQALAAQLGYEGSLAPEALENEIRFYQRRSVEACMALGACLLLLKEVTPHGEFKDRIEALGLNYRMAARFMSATLKFSKSDTKSLLNASGNQSKLLELAMLDDEEIAELSSGGSARGIELDDIATMTVTELRAALREAKADAEATGRVLEEKNKKIDELATDKKKRKTATPWPTQFADLNDEISQIGSVADEVMGKHLTFIDAVEALYESTPEEHIGAAKSSVHRIGDAVARLCYLAASLRDQYEARLVGYVVEDRTHILTDDAS